LGGGGGQKAQITCPPLERGQVKYYPPRQTKSATPQEGNSNRPHPPCGHPRQRETVFLVLPRGRWHRRWRRRTYWRL